MGSFVKHFNGKSSQKKKIIIFQADVTHFDKKGIVYFLFAKLTYVHNAQ